MGATCAGRFWSILYLWYIAAATFPSCFAGRATPVVPTAPRACTTCRGPVHSWDTVPVSLHTCQRNTNERGEFGSQDLDIITKFPLVTIEKWQGDRAVDSSTGRPVFLWEEDAWINAARSIKAADANTSVVVWMDTILVYTGWNVDPANTTVNKTLNPDADFWCGTGHFRPAEYLEREGRDLLLRNKTGQLAVNDWSKCHVYEHRKPEARAYWRDMCLNLTASGVIDGCGADFSAMGANRWSAHNPSYIAHELGLSEDVAAEWAAGHRRMMADTQAALGDGLLVAKDGAELGDHANGVLQEQGCNHASNRTVNNLRELVARARAAGPAGRRWAYQCHSDDASVHTLAAFLAGAGHGHYLTVGGWADGLVGHWSDDFSRPLGAPLGEAIYNGSSWLRHFASGTRVTFTPQDNGGIGEIEWSDTLLTESQRAV